MNISSYCCSQCSDDSHRHCDPVRSLLCSLDSESHGIYWGSTVCSGQWQWLLTGPAAGSGGEDKTEQGVASGPRSPGCRRAWQVHLPVVEIRVLWAVTLWDSSLMCLPGHTAGAGGSCNTVCPLLALPRLPPGNCWQHLWTESCYRLRLPLGARVSENFSRSEP